MFLKRKMNDSTNSYSDKILQIKEKISQADAVIIGAGAGLSTSAGFVYDGELQKPEDGEIKRIVPSGLIPYCPHCGKPMSMNLRSDQTFVEDEGWHWAAERYEKFIQEHKKQKIVFLELGVGYNIPVIIKYPFWQMTAKNPNAIYVCINQGQAVCPQGIEQRSICMNADIGQVLQSLSDAAIE